MTTTTLLRASDTKRAMIAGAADMIPFLVGLLPFGLAIGVAVAASPLDDVVGWATGPILFAGASQLSAIELLGSGAAPLTVVLSVLVLNARFALYGAALAPMLAEQPRWFRWFAPYFIVDPVVATVTAHADEARTTSWRRWHYLGASAALWVLWTGSIAAGVVMGPAIDPSWSLDFAAPLCLMAMLAARLRERDSGTTVAVAVAGTVAVSSLFLPPGIAVVGAMLAGSAAAAAWVRGRGTR